MSSHGAYDALRELILEGHLQPNQRLVESDLAAQVQASRSAVRLALQRLQADGLVEHERHRGARVRLVGVAEAVEILEVRAVLEALSVRSTAERATEADVAGLRAILAGMRACLDAGDLLGASDRNAILHRTLLEHGRHGTASRLVTGLNAQLVRFQFRTILVPGRSERSFGEHVAIVDAVAAGDADAAEAAMRLHLGNVTAALRRSAETVSSNV